MVEILIYGRGGQGNVTAAELLALAAFEDGKFTQAFPMFGSERMGSPVQAYVRISEERIRFYGKVTEPDILVIQDESLIGNQRVMGSVKAGGIIIANSKKKASELPLTTETRVWTIPAQAIAMDVVGRPIVNVVMLGAFAAVTGEVSLEAIQKVVKKRFPGIVGEKNAAAARKAYDFMKVGVLV